MKPDNEDLSIYYAQRAAEYEAIYEKLERQADLLAITQQLQTIFSEKSVLEIACGTGYWTQKIAETATSVHASDINDAVLQIAQSKVYPNNNVQFLKANLYEIEPVSLSDALFGGFIWSHIKLEALAHFMEQINQLVPIGGTVVLIDNLFVPGSNTPIAEKDAKGNTYQRRYLKNGTSHLVLKNFPDRASLAQVFMDKAQNFQYFEFQHFWMVVYQTQ